MKIIFIAVTVVVFLYSTITAAVSDSIFNNATAIIGALTLFVTALVASIIKLWTFIHSMRTEVKTVRTEVTAVKDTVEVVKKSIDGLLEQKSKADIALGTLKGIEDAAKEEGIANKREVEIRRQQDLLNQQPLKSGSTTSDDVSDVKDALETEIHKQGEKIQEAVKEKGDEIKKEVPPITAEEVVKKLDPKDSK